MKGIKSFLRKIKSPFPSRKGKEENKKQEWDISQREAHYQELPLSADLEKNLETIREITGDSYDLNLNRFTSGPQEVPGALIYLDGMVDTADMEELLRVLKLETLKIKIEKGFTRAQILETVKNRILSLGEVREAHNIKELYDGVSMGETAVLFDGTERALLCETRGWLVRAVAEPESETAIRGPREGFVENIRTNTSLIRRRIRSPNLWIESLRIGSLTKTEVAVVYIKGLAGEEMLEEVRSRLKGIDIDGVLESGTLEAFLADTPYTFFSTLFRTERVDRVSAALLEGRVTIFTSGTPFALVVPADFNMFLQAPDDYFELFPIGTFIRFLRHITFWISLFLPGFYVAVLSYHLELVPTDLLLRIQTAREGVPFPVVVEVLMMEAAFEVLREAGLRLPKAIGAAISIVGALILGDAAVRAGIVSPGVVIIVAFTAISSFATPVFSFAISARIYRFLVILLGAAAGLLGIQFAFLVLLIHLVSLRSFGYPYMAPLGPFIWQDMKDNLIVLYQWQLSHRPKLLGYREPLRQRPGQKPRPGGKSGDRKGRGKS